ncbi:PREDICTED: pentatricopeptide repeat-containing protein At3g02330 [Tarenaya hassleriana]|uniref:Pentatricopeptide repeat-containing protein n=1 Tax=Tarenaya spinosa TaxID=228870 RepID=Q1KUT6_9ROSI|nr:PREDICTED: pentatricopeptide repeat-containing protein At3g02330 [Tarenaya hassleriana]ABD96900.1 hypothetical protein [Tarenaya spinosa]
MAENLMSMRLTRVVLLFHQHLTKNIPYRRVRIFSISTASVNHEKPATSVANFSFVFKECAKQRAHELGKQAHAHMIISGFRPTVFVSNCLLQLYINCGNLGYATKLFDGMPLRDVVSWNAMIFGYAASNDMVRASLCFEMMPTRDVVSWNSMLSGFLQTGENLESVKVFIEMGRSGVEFDNKSFSVILKVCSILENYKLGTQIHGIALRMGYDTDVVSGSALLDMYAKCKRLDESFTVFYAMPQKNWISWSAIIAGCVQNNFLDGGLKMFKEMQKVGVGVSQSIYASVLKSCATLPDLRLGTQLHAHALKSDFVKDGIVRTATLDMYAKCNNMQDAQRLFDMSENLNLQSYNAMITGYSQKDNGFRALLLFRKLSKSSLGFDEISLSGALRACATVKGLSEGLQLHGLATKSNFSRNICVANAFIDMYGKCEALDEACRVFDEMGRKDAVSWNAIIAAHEQNEERSKTLNILVSMLRSGMEPDEYTFGSVLKACAGDSLNHGMEIHTTIVKLGMASNPYIGSSLVDMYSKCGMIDEAEKIHNKIFIGIGDSNTYSEHPETIEEPKGIQDRRVQEMIVSWNAIISGYVMRKQSEDAQRFFNRMMEMGITPDKFTYSTVLDTCANLASIGLGKQIHAHVIKKELQYDVYICSTLVDMYSKCGNLHDSRLMFEKAPIRDFVTWNAMICGYAHHGMGEEAIKLFESMVLMNIMPNHATFVSLLRACAHMGLVERGLDYFHMMKKEYGLDPRLEHYSNMVDILGKSGEVEKALELIQEMPFEADDVIWRTLLSACKINRNNVEAAEVAANALLRLDPQDSSTYILLSNIYADAGMWDKASELRTAMRSDKLKKEPGCSWVEIRDEFHTFLVGDKAHPRWKEIYNGLALIYNEMNLSVGGTMVEISGFYNEVFEQDQTAEPLMFLYNLSG